METKGIVFLVGILFVTLFLSLWSPVGDFSATPKYWWDESFTIEIARTFLETGSVDMTIAPNTPSAAAITVNANGFPLSVPLAGFFRLFGIGLYQARIYMIIWIFATIAFLYFFIWDFFDLPTACIGTLLVASFASFYANGRTATGDIPGFFFLLLGLWIILRKKNYFWGGIFIGLAAVTKISLYHLALPAIAFTILFSRNEHRIQKIALTALGSIVIGVVWLGILLPRPYSWHSILPGVQFYLHPFGKPSLLARLPGSLPEIFLSSTILYFLILVGIIIFAFKKNIYPEHKRNVFIFFFAYSTLQSIKFLLSPGWNRYLIGVELLAFVCLPAALYSIFRAHQYKLSYLYISMGLLISLHIGQYLFFSNIFSKPNAMQFANAIHSKLMEEPKNTVGFINDPLTAAFIPGNKKYQYIRVGGDTYVGKNPLENPIHSMPTYLVNADKERQPIVDIYYNKISLGADMYIYKKKVQ